MAVDVYLRPNRPVDPRRLRVERPGDDAEPGPAILLRRCRNRTQTVINGVTTAYTSTISTSILTVGATSYSYDLDGNLITKTDGTGTTVYTYNDQNQLLASSRPGHLVLHV